MPKINISKPIILMCIIFVGLFCASQNVLAYDNSVTHPALTREIIKYYNNYFNQNISVNDMEAIAGGSIGEDEPGVRTLNHFYDPINKRGLNSSHAGLISPIYGFLMPFSKSAKEWANNSFAQANFLGEFYANSALNPYAKLTKNAIDIQTTYTWDKAIYKYIIGDKRAAFESLGHVLHLLEDMAVPAHTRNDPHITGDLYEMYVAKNIAGSIDTSGLEPPFILFNLDDYFNGLATYSNNNFYSTDSIGMQNDYKLPEWNYLNIKTEGDFIFSIENDCLGEYILAKRTKYNSVFLSTKNDIDMEHDMIRNSYWSHLSKRAISYGAGLVDLFFKEVDKLKNDSSFLGDKKTTFLGKVVGAVGNFINNVGDVLFNNNQNVSTISVLPSATFTSSPVVIPTSSPQINGMFLEVNNNVPSGTSPVVISKTSTTSSPALTPTMAPKLTLTPTSTVTSSPILTQTPTPKPTTVSYGGGYYSKASGTSTTTPTPVLTPIPTISPTSTPESSVDPTPTIVPDPTVEPTPTTTPTPQVVISEFLYDAVGTDAGKEFIELYNAGDDDVNLSDWSLRLKINESTSTESLIIFGKNEQDKIKIIAKGFLLVGLNNYDVINYNKAADAVRSVSLGQQSETNYEIQLLSNEDILIDSVVYMSNSAGEGQSLERKANSSSTIDSMINGVDQYSGNNFDDTDNLSDFIIRNSPEPQNSNSLLEPRQRPPKVINLTGETRSDIGAILIFDLAEATTTPVSFIVKSSATTTNLIESSWDDLADVDIGGIIFNDDTDKYELSLVGVATTSVDYFVVRNKDLDGLYSEISDAYQFLSIADPTPEPTPIFNLLFFEGFEDYSSGNLNGQKGWSNVESFPYYQLIVTNDESYGGDNSVSLYNSQDYFSGYSIYEKKINIEGDGIFSFKLKAHSSPSRGEWINNAYLTFTSSDSVPNSSWSFGMVPTYRCYTQVALISSDGQFFCVPGGGIDVWHNFQIELRQHRGVRVRVDENEWSEWKQGGSWGEYSGKLEKIGITGRLDNRYWFDDLSFSSVQSPHLQSMNQTTNNSNVIEGNTVFSDSVTFQSIISSSLNNPVKMQVELKDASEPFTGDGDILETEYSSSNGLVSVSKNNLSNKSYHWRARAVDSQDNASEWEEFGSSGNIDFVIDTNFSPIYFEGFEGYLSGDFNNQNGWASEGSGNQKMFISGSPFQGNNSLYYGVIETGGSVTYSKAIDINGDGIFSFRLKANSTQGPQGSWSNIASLRFFSKDNPDVNNWIFGMVPSGFGSDPSNSCYQQTALVNSHGGYICSSGAWVNAWYNFQIEFSQTNGIRVRVDENEWSEWQKGENWGEFAGGLGKISISVTGGSYRENKYYFDNFQFLPTI